MVPKGSLDELQATSGMWQSGPSGQVHESALNAKSHAALGWCMKAHTAVQRRTGCRSSQQHEGLDASSLQPCLAQEHIKEVLQDGAELGHAGRWGAIGNMSAQFAFRGCRSTG